MVTARKRTILSPIIPRAVKAKPTADAPGERWRSRPTLPGPFGDDEPPFYGTEAEVRERAAVDQLGGMAPVVECYTGGAGWYLRRPRVTCAMLGKLGHARALEVNAKGEGTVWQILPEGQRLINESLGL